MKIKIVLILSGPGTSTELWDLSPQFYLPSSSSLCYDQSLDSIRQGQASTCHNYRSTDGETLFHNTQRKLLPSSPYSFLCPISFLEHNSIFTLLCLLFLCFLFLPWSAMHPRPTVCRSSRCPAQQIEAGDCGFWALLPRAALMQGNGQWL